MDEKKCETCKKALFNYIWGEFICSVSKRKAKDSELENGCDSYENGKPGVSKGIEELGC